MNKQAHTVTGACGYTGKYIAELLQKKDKPVIALTNSVNRPNPYGDRIKAYPFNFDNPELLRENLKNIKVLYNASWVRFNHKQFTHAGAAANKKILFDAAKADGIERIVHVSITNPRVDSDLEYFSGKADLENYLKETRISYCRLRPAVILGKEDILIDNIAWVLRKYQHGILCRKNYRLV